MASSTTVPISPATPYCNVILEVEKRIYGALGPKSSPTFAEIEQLLARMYEACLTASFLDFFYVTIKGLGVGKRLWDVHVAINNRYRKLVDTYRKSQNEQMRNSVEHRKVERRYAAFLKTSQYFYKCYIQRISSHYGGVPGLRRIADRLSLDISSVDEAVMVDGEMALALQISCHSTLLHLGDLSRYRNMLRTQDRSWKVAIAYYNLADALCPDIGSAQNQLAVIALADANHLDAVLHLYRATTAKEAYPLARGNLEIEFKKISTAWDKQRSLPQTNSLNTLTWWFVLLHSRYYEGKIFSTREELENEVLSRLRVLLKTQSFDDILEKFVLINVASQTVALKRVDDLEGAVPPNIIKSFFYTLSFNIRFLCLLLEVLLGELNIVSDAEYDAAEPISDVARRVLPVIRQYNVWLALSAQAIRELRNEPDITAYAPDMWRLYANLIIQIGIYFRFEKQEGVGYLQDEDALTLGFGPFRDEKLVNTFNLYTSIDGVAKPFKTDPGVPRFSLQAEMKARVLNITVFALHLIERGLIPIVRTNGNPILEYYDENAAPLPEGPISQGRVSPPRTFEQSQVDHQIQSPTLSYPVFPAESNNGSQISMEHEMYRMVDDLVEQRSNARPDSSDETSGGMHNATVNDVFPPTGSNGYEHRYQSTPKMLPSLPGLYSTAFAPKPNELQPTSPHRPSTARELSPLSLATHEDRAAAAARLDKTTGGYRPSRKSGSYSRQSVNQSLQEQLINQFGSSSNFSESSNIYANNTPRTHTRYPSGNNFGVIGPRSSVSFSASNGMNNVNNTTYYAGNSEFDRTTRLRSSLWNGSQPATWGNMPTPPPGQGHNGEE